MMHELAPSVNGTLVGGSQFAAIPKAAEPSVAETQS